MDARSARSRSEAGVTGEVPIGACIVDEAGNLLAVAGNRTITDNDPTAHAEILALRDAAAKIGNYRLTGRDRLHHHRALRDVCRGADQCPGKAAGVRRGAMSGSGRSRRISVSATATC